MHKEETTSQMGGQGKGSTGEVVSIFAEKNAKMTDDFTIKSDTSWIRRIFDAALICVFGADVKKKKKTA